MQRMLNPLIKCLNFEQKKNNNANNDEILRIQRVRDSTEKKLMINCHKPSFSMVFFPCCCVVRFLQQMDGFDSSIAETKLNKIAFIEIFRFAKMQCCWHQMPKN